VTSGGDLSLWQFNHPRFWPTWGLLLGMRAIALLPLRAQMRVGRTLGRSLKYVKARDRRVARRNLEICFPELSPVARESLLDRHMESVGLSLVEMAIGWYSPLAKLERIITVHGREHLDAARAAGNGVLLLGAHFTPLEVGVSILEAFDGTFSCMYRPQRNALMDTAIRRGRSRFAATQIPRDDVRTLIRRLREKDTVVYLPDQTYLGNQSALIPFFGEPAVTNIAASRLARITGAAVLTYFFRRRDDGSGYDVEIGAPLADFPTDDPIHDSTTFVALLEAYIRRAPDQYLWLYKKFKKRPSPLPDVYRAPVG
jgi:KDO2-lipid IV(A) lauroyltransferase